MTNRPRDALDLRTEDPAVLRSQMRSMAEEARRNEEIFRKMMDREREVLSAATLPELLDLVVGGLGRSWGLDAVTLALEDPQHVIRHLLLGDGHAPDRFPGVIFTDHVVSLAPQMRTLARPWLGPYSRPDHRLLFPRSAALGSLAILPLVRSGKLIGTLNLGSNDPLRYTRHHETDFQVHLGIIVAFALENTCNRAQLLRAGMTDYLTGWHNRRYLASRLREELARAQRTADMVSLLMMDLDNFKELNDSCGHLGGDAAIRELAVRIESQIRASDAAARFGGDEFAVLLPGAALADAQHLAERIQRTVTGTPVDLGAGLSRPVTLSIGIAATGPAAAGADLKAQADRLLAEADAALYRAKAAGRNRIEVSS